MNLNSLLGFSRAAGKLQVGRMACLTAVRRGKAKAILLACDASRSTVSEFERLAFEYGVKIYQLDVTRDELGAMVGKGALAVVCLTDTHFANELRELVKTD